MFVCAPVIYLPIIGKQISVTDMRCLTAVSLFNFSVIHTWHAVVSCLLVSSTPIYGKHETETIKN